MTKQAAPPPPAPQVRTYVPDELDQVMQPTNPRSWLVLLALTTIVGVAIAWSVYGRVFNKVQARGILVRAGGVLELVAPAEGRVGEILVSVGDSLTRGQVVARLAQPELVEHLTAARAKAAAARASHTELVAFTAQQAGLERETSARQRVDLNASIKSGNDNLALLQARLEAQQALLSQGLVTQTTLLATKQQVDRTADEIRQSESGLAQVDLKQSDNANRRTEDVRQSQVRLAEADADVARYERQLSAQTEIVSPFTGRILEVVVEPGKILQRGETMMTLDLTGGGGTAQELVAVAYVPAVYGKMIKPGMPLHISPSTVRQEEYGMLVGAVTFVSDYPATSKGIQRVLKNEKLVHELSGESAPYELHARLFVDSSTTSGYRWSSSKGPPLQVESGTLATVAVTVRAQRPIELILPMVRRWVGL